MAEVPEPQEAPDPQRRGQADPRQLRGARPLHSVSVFACDPREYTIVACVCGGW